MPISPQLAKPVKSYDDLLQAKLRAFSLEVKVDGMRAIVEKHGSTVGIYSRTGKSQTGKLPHLEQTFASYPGDFILDGEIANVDSFKPFKLSGVPIVDFNSTMRVMGSNPSKAVTEQKRNGMLHFIVFDCLMEDGRSLITSPDALRRKSAERLVQQFDTYRIHIIPRWSDWKPEWYGELIRIGVEGIVLKDGLAPYRPGKRSSDWLKLKDTETEDVIITGYNEGHGDMKGLIGSVTFGQIKNGKVEPRGQCSGMDMKTRKMFTARGSEFIDKVLEIKAFGRTGSDEADSWFRHPQFIRLRDDKRPEECLWT